MNINPTIDANKNIIDSYGTKGFEIQGKFYNKSIALDVDDIEELKVNSLKDFLNNPVSKLLNNNIEILIIGTGKNHVIIDSKIKQLIKSSFPNVSINEMTSDSACRTYNILAFEERKVMAILFPL